MIDYEQIKEELRSEGVVSFSVDKTKYPLLKLVSSIGRIVPGDRGEMIQSLQAQEKGAGSFGAFSYSVGYGPFPWHTDTAYWELPVRYLLLTSDKTSPCATLFRSFDSLISEIEDFKYLASRAVFMLNIPGRRRLLSPIIRENGVEGYRMDYHIYKPMNEEAKALSELMQEHLENEHNRVIWTGNNVVILDNWRFIHSREEAIIDKDRSLKRVYINELV